MALARGPINGLSLSLECAERTAGMILDNEICDWSPFAMTLRARLDENVRHIHFPQSPSTRLHRSLVNARQQEGPSSSAAVFRIESDDLESVTKSAGHSGAAILTRGGAISDRAPSPSPSRSSGAMRSAATVTGVSSRNLPLHGAKRKFSNHQFWSTQAIRSVNFTVAHIGRTACRSRSRFHVFDACRSAAGADGARWF